MSLQLNWFENKILNEYVISIALGAHQRSTKTCICCAIRKKLIGNILQINGNFDFRTSKFYMTILSLCFARCEKEKKRKTGAAWFCDNEKRRFCHATLCITIWVEFAFAGTVKSKPNPYDSVWVEEEEKRQPRRGIIVWLLGKRDTMARQRAGREPI